MPKSTIKASDSLAFSAPQTAALLAAKAWWQEDDRQLDYLAERARYRTLLEQAASARDHMRSQSMPSGNDAAPLLRYARVLSPNSALNRTRETDTFAQALQELLFGEAPLAERLTHFVGEIRGIGVFTASQLLYVAFPDRYPLVTETSRSVLARTREQINAAREAASERFGDTDVPQITSLLGDFVSLDLARHILNLPDFADLDAVLRHAREMPRDGGKRKRSKATQVKEEESRYTTPPPEPTEIELLRYLEGYIVAQGFQFPPLAVRDYYLALKTKPFAILAGLSGTGKTRLTELIAEALTDNLRGQYRLLPVRPDWSDPSPLLGYHNALTGTYIGTPFLDLLREAGRRENQDRAYFVCLDEMNLARAEHYFADILSAMETRRREIPLAGTFDAIALSPNVFLSGTVNIEEGTHPFGLKVLDRANVIEFSEVSMSRPTPSLPTVLPEIAPLERQRLFLADRMETTADAESRLGRANPAFVERFYATLTALNDLLAERGLHFGYRVRDESLRYLAYSFTSEGIPLLVEGDDREANFLAAIDLQIVQKILPRITGTYERLDTLLSRLAAWSDTESLPRTTEKLRRMRRRAADEGIVSFWE